MTVPTGSQGGPDGPRRWTIWVHKFGAVMGVSPVGQRAGEWEAVRVVEESAEPSPEHDGKTQSIRHEPSPERVEAGARALWAARFWGVEDPPDWDDSPELDAVREDERRTALAVLRAAAAVEGERKP